MGNHGRVRRGLHIFSISLITAGVVILADVAMTLAWKEPLSTIYGTIQQGHAQDELSALEESFLATPAVRAIAEPAPRENPQQLRERARKLAGLYAEQVTESEGIGRLEIADIGLGTVVVEGTTTATLQKGPGRYPDTAFPGQGKTIGIAGHRTTYLAPLRRINEIDDGDEVVLEMPYGTFTYTVEKHEIVDPSQVEIVDDVGYERLVLTACHPLYSAAQRWAVFAKLSEISLSEGDAAAG